jgi:hypothetical protein
VKIITNRPIQENHSNLFGHKKRKHKGGFFKTAWHDIKMVGFAPERGAFLVLLKLNAWGLSTKLANLRALSKSNPKAKTIWDKSLLHWVKMGGKETVFNHNIDIGKHKKELLVRKKKQVKLAANAFDGEEYHSVAGVDDAAEAVVASTPVWIPIVGILSTASAIGIGGKLLMNPKDNADAVAAANDPANQSTPEQDAAAQAELAKQQSSSSNASITNEPDEVTATNFISKLFGDTSDNNLKPTTNKQHVSPSTPPPTSSQGMSKNMKTGLIIGGSVLLVGIIVTVIVVMHKKK